MASPTPRPRTRGGGTPLILLGIVLAVATAVLVLFLTSNGNVSIAGGTNVVVAARNLDAGTILSATNGTKPFARVGDAFRVQRMSSDAVPGDAYVFANQSDLTNFLNGQIVTSRFLSGDVLRKTDGRIASLGNGPAQSVTNHNVLAMPDGDVLFALHVGDSQGMQVGAQEGDHVDVLATECVTSTARNGCQITQTTLQNLPIYMVGANNATLFVVVSHQEALVLKLLVETAKIDLVLRRPGDTAPAATQPVDPTWIINHFGFQPPG